MKNKIQSFFVKMLWIFLIVFSMIFSGYVFGASSGTVELKRVPPSSKIKKNATIDQTGNPDLMVLMVKVNPKTPTVSKDLINIKVTVKNRGTAATSAVCHLTMSVFSVDNSGNRISGNSLMAAIPGYTNNIPILGPGAKHEISKTITLHHAGRNQIEGVINTESLQAGEESNHQNNYYKSYFTVKPKPAPADLVLHKITVTPDGRIKIKMSNSGKAIPDEDFNRAWVKAEVDGYPYKQLHLKDMDQNGLLKKPGPTSGMPGQIFVNFIWPDTGPQAIKLSAGNTYTVTVTLDCFPKIVDSNRSNNTRTVTLSP